MSDGISGIYSSEQSDVSQDGKIQIDEISLGAKFNQSERTPFVPIDDTDWQHERNKFFGDTVYGFALGENGLEGLLGGFAYWPELDFEPPANPPEELGNPLFYIYYRNWCLRGVAFNYNFATKQTRNLRLFKWNYHQYNEDASQEGAVDADGTVPHKARWFSAYKFGYPTGKTDVWTSGWMPPPSTGSLDGKVDSIIDALDSYYANAEDSAFGSFPPSPSTFLSDVTFTIYMSVSRLGWWMEWVLSDPDDPDSPLIPQGVKGARPDGTGFHFRTHGGPDASQESVPVIEFLTWEYPINNKP